MERLQISIPKPCHQDWNQMTPEERGRFCSMCRKTVIDFSDKTEDEILSFIRLHRNENICGRFRSDQLAQPERIELPLPVYRSQLSFINTFLAALLFCFGTALFSCNMPPTPPAVAGEVQVHSAETPVKNISSPDDNTLIGDTIILDVSKPIYREERFTKGKVGKVIVQPETVDLPIVEIMASPHLYTSDLIMGGMIAVVIQEPYYTDDTDSANAESVASEETIPGKEIFFSVYPNPSTGLFNVEFQPAQEQNVQMDLYDLSGRLVRNLVAGEIMQPELRTLQLDISDQPPGIYFIRTSAGDNVKTERVVIAER